MAKAKGSEKRQRGYLPCFSKYLSSKYPLDEAYQNDVFIEKLRRFLSAIIKTPNVFSLKESGGCKEIQVIAPDGSQEDRRIVAQCDWHSGKIYRAKYGNTPYRIIFGIDAKEKRCYIFGLDSGHSTFSGKNRK